MTFEKLKTPEELYVFMKENIAYGFVSNYNQMIYTPKSFNNYELYNRLLYESYYLQTPAEVLESKHGLCWDQVELVRYWLMMHGYNVYTFFIKIRNHAVIIYEKDNRFYWFERTFKPLNGIRKFSSLSAVLNFIRKAEAIVNKVELFDIDIFKYDEVVFGSDFYTFRNKIMLDEGKKLVLNKKMD